MNGGHCSRRTVLASASALALLDAAAAFGAGGPPPETTRLRLSRVPTICLAPQYIAEALLSAEGFTDIQYVGDGPSHTGVPGAQKMGAGELDLAMNFAAPLVVALDQGAPIVLLGGVHAGCFELFGAEGVRTIKDLKGKTVATLGGRGSAPYIFLASIATSIGLDPNRDINWFDISQGDKERLLADGKIDAYLAFPPDGQELRARKVGHTLLNSAVDRPWSQYFCCLVSANQEFVRKNPVAAKRALRAILKASEMCVTDPNLGVQAYLARGFTARPEIARQAITELPYGHWRDYNPEETVRFYALRLREAGMVKANPQKLISQGTDWRILDQLKREMKS
jgi:NitT/TauT family transport system substrate-binding protein